MRYAILYAHPNPKSFNHAILERVEANLKRDRKEYVARDLYALSFKPALEGADFVAMG
ncbi:MAG TPA: NAD(P)H-dependent oxidoreductase, partial [bacterium]|nr:NAD(P)H-dependent oxidoreductase [bacterium]